MHTECLCTRCSKEKIINNSPNFPFMYNSSTLKIISQNRSNEYSKDILYLNIFKMSYFCEMMVFYDGIFIRLIIWITTKNLKHHFLRLCTESRRLWKYLISVWCYAGVMVSNCQEMVGGYAMLRCMHTCYCHFDFE